LTLIKQVIILSIHVVIVCYFQLLAIWHIHIYIRLRFDRK
jgi:hypothetical protein